MKRECLKCGKKINWKQQIIDWCDTYGEAWENEAILMIRCDKCDSYAGEVEFVEDTFEEEIIKNEKLGDVKIPKFN